MSTILVTEEIRGAAMDAMRQAFDVTYDPALHERPQEIESIIGSFSALMVRNQTQVSAPVIAASKTLKVIGRAGVGVDNIDLQAATDHGIVVVYTPEQNAISVAEMTIALLLGLARKLCEADSQTKRGQWKRHECTGFELYGKTLGVLGLGRIGFLTAQRAKAFGMDIVAHDPFVSPEAVTVTELRAPLVELDDLARRSDAVVCHLPATDQSRRCLTYRWFCQMKPTAFFVNTSRGDVVDEPGLIRALTEHKLAGAALDVRASEPPGPDALSEMPNVILTPHIGAFTKEAQQRVVRCVCHDVAAVLGGEKPRHFVNFAKPQR